MIKLVVSDIDGTLLPYGETQLNPRLFSLIKQLEEQGITFCPASGRQYHSLRSLFAPLQDELTYLCENGAILYGPGPEESAPILDKFSIPREDALALAQEILNLEGSELLISGANCCYLCNCPDSYVSHIRDFKGNRAIVVDHLEEIQEDMIKVSAYCPHGTHYAETVLGPRWAHKLQMAIAGADWLDFTLSNKGLGLEKLCHALGVSPGEVLAFGDNWNDESMLSAAGYPYLMETADPALKEKFPNHCRQVEDVLQTLVCQGKLN